LAAVHRIIGFVGIDAARLVRIERLTLVQRTKDQDLFFGHTPAAVGLVDIGNTVRSN
jgi:hypothetical protein